MMEPPGSTSYMPRYPDVRVSITVENRKKDSSPHTNAGPSSLKYECDYCGKGFNRPSSLQIHLNSHTRRKAFQRAQQHASACSRACRASGRYHEDSDESNDAHSRSGR
ncbi:hypothetical protein DFJ58DRAFT_775693 [Suillus subalutaceus]|uniref:uncharacterized protein n=1 Tax=Suillus subalutaceus TaxID=48586 RepID=UPI001B8833E0|nr:uncharacterized protein DFJ58DRAFT_775693 [Suillus subalutaceus]KAG1862557.1 hypothetical protein DFJ58DRAFT_775693 [Suillus subalutaceus]